MAVLDFLMSIVGMVRAYLVSPIGRRLGYLIYYRRNIENLRNQVEKLNVLKHGVQGFAEATRSRGEEIRADVENWIRKVNEITEWAEMFLKDDASVNKSCLSSWCSRYRVSREASEKIMVITELQEEGKVMMTELQQRGKVDIVSSSAPPPEMESMSAVDFVDLDSMRLVMTQVIEALKDNMINAIGICGVGGVGKTTLVKQVGKQVKEAKLFGEVVMAVVSQTNDLERIRGQIATVLGLKLEVDNELVAASKLRARLKDYKTILLILDDVRAELDLSALGIPLGSEHRGCKVVFTTRSSQVCDAMGLSETKKIIHLNVLSEQESWNLFRRNCDESIDSPTLNVLANEAVRECKGLPLALVTVGRAMRNKDLQEWKEAVQELKKSKPADIEGVNENVFKCLKLSFDYIQDSAAKSFFLLCALFPEDYDILVEDLVRYGIGWGIFEDVRTVEDVRLKSHALVNNLRSSCLLLASEKEGHVKLPNTVRDFAISMVSEVFMVRPGVNLKEWPQVQTWERYTAISLMQNSIGELPDALECPNLQILLLQGNDFGSRIPEAFLEGKGALKVLDLSHTIRTASLPKHFSHLSNLRTLILNGNSLGDISVVGGLRKLEILSFTGCRDVDLPRELGQLTNLRVLDLMNCSGKISPGLISSLSLLEELYAGAYEIQLAEVKSLHQLKILSIGIDDIKSMPDDFHFPELVRSNIFVGLLPEFYPTQKTIALFSIQLPLPICIEALLQTALESLRLWHMDGLRNVLPYLSLVGFNNLKSLVVLFCSCECLINTMEWIPQLAFSNLEKLEIMYLRELKVICHGVLPARSLSKLRYLSVSMCRKLVNVLVPYSLLQRLHNLEAVRVQACYQLEEVFNFELTVGEEQQLFGSLTELSLVHLWKLKHIWKGPAHCLLLHSLKVVHIDFCGNIKFIFPLAQTQCLPKLEELTIENCPALEGIILMDAGWEKAGPQILCFRNLERLRVSGCHKLRSLFTPSIARGLLQLQQLDIAYCEDMQEIVAEEKDAEQAPADNTIVFPQLETMTLSWLSNLTTFCPVGFPIEWPSLEEVNVKVCPSMKNFTAAPSGVQSTPKLMSVKVDDVEKKLDEVDINSIIQNYFKEKILWYWWKPWELPREAMRLREQERKMG